MKKQYLDLRIGDKLGVANLEILVMSIVQKGTMMLSVNGNHRTLRVDTDAQLSDNVSMYNFGNRGCGNRIHVRLRIPDKSRYAHTKYGR